MAESSSNPGTPRYSDVEPCRHQFCSWQEEFQRLETKYITLQNEYDKFKEECERRANRIAERANGITQRAICYDRDIRMNIMWTNAERDWRKTASSEQRKEYEDMDHREQCEILKLTSIGKCPVCLEKQYHFNDILKCDNDKPPAHGVCKKCLREIEKREDSNYKSLCPICRLPSYWSGVTLEVRDIQVDPACDEFLFGDDTHSDFFKDVLLPGVKLGTNPGTRFLNQYLINVN